MREPLEEDYCCGIVQERRRLCTILLSTCFFTLLMPFARHSEHFLAIGIGCICFLFALVFIPGRWFYQSRPELVKSPSGPGLTSGGPRPRTQPPAAPAREPLTRWPPREGPLPPLPPRPPQN